MKSPLKFLSSLCITVAMSFLAPMMIFGLILTVGSAIGVLPGMTAELLTGALTNFLEVFGSGNAWEGVLVIAIAFSFVGGMFETFNFYYYQNIN